MDVFQVCRILILFNVMSYFGVYGKLSEGQIVSAENWEFITRFCFLSDKGMLDFEFTYPTSYKIQKVLLYYDTEQQWKSVYKTNTNCTQKLSVLNPRNNQIITLTELSGCQTEPIQGVEHYVCKGQRIFVSSRERWWFVAVSRCELPGVGQPVGLNLKYKIHMTNGPVGDYLHREYSADEFYIMPIAAVFLFIYVIMCVLTFICAVMLHKRQLLHRTYRLYIATIITWTVYLVWLTAAYGGYGNDGASNKLVSANYAARSLKTVSTLLFLLMLILMGKGYTITRGRLSSVTTLMIVIFFIIYTITYIVLFIYEGVIFDPGLVLYLYESPPGYGLIAMRLIGWAWFCFATLRTLSHHKKKIRFFLPFFFFYTAWFWAGPIVIIVARFALADWSREKTVVAVECFVALCGHVFFLVLTRPNKANTTFPFHIRTSQIGVAGAEDTADTGLGGSSMYEISSEQTTRGGGPNLTNLFTTSQSHSTATEHTFNNNNTQSKQEESQLPNGDTQTETNGVAPSYESMFGARSTTPS